MIQMQSYLGVADNSCNEGDIVRVAECAPMSKTKNWRVVTIVTRAAE